MPLLPLPVDFALETERLRLRIPEAADLPHVFSGVATDDALMRLDRRDWPEPPPPIRP